MLISSADQLCVSYTPAPGVAFLDSHILFQVRLLIFSFIHSPNRYIDYCDLNNEEPPTEDVKQKLSEFSRLRGRKSLAYSRNGNKDFEIEN